MDSVIKRSTRDGIVVSFRNDDDNSLLWTAQMNSIPSVDAIVGHYDNGAEPANWWEVKSVKFEFDHEKGISSPGVNTLSQSGAVCYCSLIP